MEPNLPDLLFGSPGAAFPGGAVAAGTEGSVGLLASDRIAGLSGEIRWRVLSG